jgi:hypothetical protein
MITLKSGAFAKYRPLWYHIVKYAGADKMQISEITRDDTLRSTVPYGTAEFPFECYLDQLEHYKSRCVEWHWHSELQFSCVLVGSVTACIGSDRIAMQTGDGLFINTGAIHRFGGGWST